MTKISQTRALSVVFSAITTGTPYGEIHLDMARRLNIASQDTTLWQLSVEAK
jgi:hypothetical protein